MKDRLKDSIGCLYLNLQLHIHVPCLFGFVFACLLLRASGLVQMSLQSVYQMQVCISLC